MGIFAGGNGVRCAASRVYLSLCLVTRVGVGGRCGALDASTNFATRDRVFSPASAKQSIGRSDVSDSVSVVDSDGEETVA